MKRSIVVAALLLVVASPCVAQSGGQAQQAGSPASRRELLFEVGGGIGYTQVDLEKWGGATATNEELMLYLFDARLLFLNAGGFHLGLEAGHRYFFYYEVPFTPSTLTRDVAAMRLGAVARRPLSSAVSLDLGAAAYMFEDFTDMGVSAALTFRFPVAGKFSIPLQVRTDLVFDEQMIIGSGATLGLSFRR
ncbi:MAG: hypothetical protein ACREMI_03400 [Gemmatimonadales bacterium]